MINNAIELVSIEQVLYQKVEFYKGGGFINDNTMKILTKVDR